MAHPINLQTTAEQIATKTLLIVINDESARESSVLCVLSRYLFLSWGQSSQEESYVHHGAPAARGNCSITHLHYSEAEDFEKTLVPGSRIYPAKTRSRSYLKLRLEEAADRRWLLIKNLLFALKGASHDSSDNRRTNCHNDFAHRY